MNTIKRNWLRKQIELGKVEAKCNYILTDDYAFDNANKFGRTDWMPARLAPPRQWETLINANGCERSRLVNVDEMSKEGYITFEDWDFTTKTGLAYWKDEPGGDITLIVHQGESHTLRIK